MLDVKKIVSVNTPFVFTDPDSRHRYALNIGEIVDNRKSREKVKVRCSCFGASKSRWLNYSEVSPANFSLRHTIYRQVEAFCVNDPKVDWLLPNASDVFNMVFDRYVCKENIEAIARNISACYSEPHRFWHNEKHMREVVLFLLKHSGINYPWLLIDALYHDICYQIGDMNNEQNSAEFMLSNMNDINYFRQVNSMGAGLNKNELPSILDLWPGRNHERGIMATKHHKTENPVVAMLLDADMEVFSTSTNKYMRYARAIRKEYGHISDPDYRKGRINFLEGMLDRPKIYTSRAATPTMESTARANVEWELSALEKGVFL